MTTDPNLSARDYTRKMGIVDDYLCAICDDGGFLVCCEGECGRLFHPNSSSGKDSNCRSLELKDDQWKPKTCNFLCKNCEYKSHQCFVCGELGSSEMPSGSPEVVKCQKKYCGRFYHPNCLLNLKYDPIKIHQDFECPLHECHSCKKNGGTIITKEQTEKEEETYLVQCRRCPVAYHRKCLPRDISNVVDGEVSRTFIIKEEKPQKQELEQPQEQERCFFYCRKHEMVGELNSATRDHLKFPEPSIPSLEHDDMVVELNDATRDHLKFPEPSIPSSEHEMAGELNSATWDHQKSPEPSVPSLEHETGGELNDHLNPENPEKHVFNFDLNEKPPEETEAPEPNASTSSAPMESSASRSLFP